MKIVALLNFRQTSSSSNDKLGCSVRNALLYIKNRSGETPVYSNRNAHP